MLGDAAEADRVAHRTIGGLAVQGRTLVVGEQVRRSIDMTKSSGVNLRANLVSENELRRTS
jgi:hypothetical protein